jgi:hypothetical protein
MSAQVGWGAQGPLANYAGTAVLCIVKTVGIEHHFNVFVAILLMSPLKFEFRNHFKRYLMELGKALIKKKMLINMMAITYTLP